MSHIEISPTEIRQMTNDELERARNGLRGSRYRNIAEDVTALIIDEQLRRSVARREQEK